MAIQGLTHHRILEASQVLLGEHRTSLHPHFPRRRPLVQSINPALPPPDCRARLPPPRRSFFPNPDPGNASGQRTEGSGRRRGGGGGGRRALWTPACASTRRGRPGAQGPPSGRPGPAEPERPRRGAGSARRPGRGGGGRGRRRVGSDSAAEMPGEAPGGPAGARAPSGPPRPHKGPPPASRRFLTCAQRPALRPQRHWANPAQHGEAKRRGGLTGEACSDRTPPPGLQVRLPGVTPPSRLPALAPDWRESRMWPPPARRGPASSCSVPGSARPEGESRWLPGG